MSFYRDLWLKSQLDKWDVKYEILFGMEPDANWSLKFEGVGHPWSIRQKEFTFIKSFVERHGLKTGYELATGVGISVLAPGLAMKDHGKILTVDAYIEENTATGALGYREAQPSTYENALGYRSVVQLINHFGLQDIVKPEVGWSPRDVAPLIEKHFDISGGEKLDYVFIDAQHFDECVIADIEAVHPYINKQRFVLFIHDTHAFSERIHTYLKMRFGTSYSICKGCEIWNDGWNLSYITPLE